MSCVNPNDPRFKEILQQVGNPLLAEIEFDKLYPEAEVPSNYKVDERVEEKYFSDSTIKRTSDVLKLISDSSHPLNKLAKHLLGFSNINDVSIVLDNVDSYQKDNLKSLGYYDPSVNEIRIAKNAKLRNGNSETLILHEVLHALSYNALRKNDAYTKAFEKLYNHSIDKLGKFNAETWEGDYANYTIDEFFVALFTDAKFIKKLQQTEAINEKEFKNLFQEIFNYILKLLKLDTNNSLYSQAFSVATNILQYEKEYADYLEEYQKQAADNTYVPLSEEHEKLLESARENLNPVEADRVEQMLKGETRFLDDSNFEMC